MRVRSLTLVAAALFPLGAFAAQIITTATTVEWQTASDAPVVLSLQRPDGEVLTETYAAGRRPLLRVETLSDGAYSYELREGEVVQSGVFSVQGGAIVPRNRAAPHARIIMNSTATAPFGPPPGPRISPGLTVNEKSRTATSEP